MISTRTYRHPCLTGSKDEDKAIGASCVRQPVDIGRFTWEDSHVGEFLQRSWVNRFVQIYESSLQSLTRPPDNYSSCGICFCVISWIEVLNDIKVSK